MRRVLQVGLLLLCWSTALPAAVVYTETDTNPTTCGTYSNDRTAARGASAGSSAMSFDIGTSQEAKTLAWKITLADENGASGTWDIRYNVTTAEMNSSITTITATHYSSACATKTSNFINSSTGWSLASTGTVTVSVSGGTLTTPAVGDIIEIVATMSSSSHSATIGITPSLTIDSPQSLQPPTIALNTADAHDFGNDTTPTLEMTATDAASNDVRYQVQIDTVSTFDSGAEAVGETYNESNQSTTIPMRAGLISYGQSFQLTTPLKLTKAKFYLSRTGSPTGNAVAKLYAHTGTFGSAGIPTGAALATSGNIDVTTIDTSLALVEFTFSGAGQYDMGTDVPYVIAVEFGGGDTTNRLNVGYDSTSPTHAGNYSSTTTGVSWSPQSGFDVIFYVYGKPALLTKVSGTDSGFVNTVTGGDTDPFNSGEKVSFTVQAGDALSGGTYYWRARASDPNGSNTWSAWPTTRTFTVTVAPPEDDSPSQVID